MAKLQQLLACLTNPEVREVVLQSNTVPYARVGNDAKPLGAQKLLTQQLLVFVTDTPLSAVVDQARASGSMTSSFEFEGHRYLTKVTYAPDALVIRVARGVEAKQEPTRAEVLKPDAHGADPRKSSIPSPPESSGIESMPLAVRSFEELGEYARLVAAARSREELGAALRELVVEARERDASDVHVFTGEPARLRAVGALRTYGPALTAEQVEKMLYGLLSEQHRADLEALGYADFGCDLGGAAARVRANVCRHRRGLKGCFRLVATEPRTLAELGLPEELVRVTEQKQGLVVVSGPGGQGKTTTLASLIDLFNSSRAVHVITVEDPVEIVHPQKMGVVSQREVGTHTRSFVSALRGSLREDPDVLAIGELRDQETVELALTAAETGKLVLSTMSTPNGARTIDRIIDMFPPDAQNQVRATMAGALKMVVSQRLVPGLDGRRNHVAAEMITGNVPLWALIRENKLYQLPSLLQRGRAWGMIKVEDSLSDLVRRGLVSLEAARRYADEPKSVVDPNAQPASVQQPELHPAKGPASPTVAPPPKPAQSGFGLGNLFGKRGG